ncbi:hypothetical protein QEH59_07770 [Coraliomargarita sp. SDUM461004]|uniref:Methyltransferase type 11 domain-containing protein n=1 Tax=Thalassobacterium sedimentorum TaxID=3041258 RepID=A0ABU1AL54_9BACT|nr:methyltransferase domain-containing protein [Coraliomargarita sp. SDUM461004]MDQ8194318.1 hypothetical protein [Coraliomargarita sp. SDUM461004]
MSEVEMTYDLSLLDLSSRAWHKKSGLRRIYQELYQQMLDACVDGASLELGSGIGVIKEFNDSVITSDLVKTPYVDRVASAYDIPLFQDQPWANIMALDVLHHLRSPLGLIESASQVLRPGGRLILMEPASTLFGRYFYRAFHVEPIAPKGIIAPYEFPADDDDGNFANMAMALELFKEQASTTESKFVELGMTIQNISYRDCLAYPLSGGYSGPQFLPGSILSSLMKIESWIPQFLLQYIGLRMLIVLEKNASV